MSIQTQFTKFLHDIEPSSTTKRNAGAAQRALRKFLREHDVFKEFHVDTFLSGSYKRDTAIRPRIIDGEETKPDVDIIVVMNCTQSDDPGAVINLLRTVLKDNKDYRFKQPPNTRSVGVLTANVDMDVVPIIAPQGMEGTLYIPDRKLESWLETNPPRHTSWTTEVNDASEGQFKPLVKLVKWWRRENPTVSKRPKGFVIECIVAGCMDYYETQYDELFVGVLENIVNRYAWAIDARVVPYIDDPGVPGNSVTDGMTFAAFEGFYSKVRAHAALGRRAQEEQQRDAEKALKIWRQILGSRFPAPGQSASKNLLRAAVPSQGLTFPNRPVLPKKPAGFA